MAYHDQKPTKLVICDFDGTLFRSPIFPDDWPDKPGFGWVSKPESLGKTIIKPDGSVFNIIPEIPGPEFFIQSTIDSIRSLSTVSTNYIILMTGRPPKIKQRIEEVLDAAGLSHIFPSERIFTVGSQRQKPNQIKKLLSQEYFSNIHTIEAFDDRDLEIIEPAAHDLGKDFIGHQIHPSDFALPAHLQDLVDQKIREYRKHLEESTVEIPSSAKPEPKSKSKDKVYYCGAVLNSQSILKLRTKLESAIVQYVESFPESAIIETWTQSQVNKEHGLEQLNHHCTADTKLHPEFEEMIGRRVSLIIDGFGVSLNDRVAAWRVASIDPAFHTTSSPHVTAMVGEGGRVGLSGRISSENFIDVDPISVEGTFEQVSDGWITNRTASVLKNIAKRLM